MTNRLRAAAGGLLAVAAVVGIIGFSPSLNTRAAGALTHRVYLPVTTIGRGAPTPNVFGVEVWGTLSQLDAVSALTAGADLAPGFSRRNSVNWATVEPHRGVYDFSATDRDLLAVARVGTRPIVIVQGTPAWARPDPSYTPTGPFPPEFLPDYARFWQALVARYAQPPYNIRHWEIYNEPDNTLAGAGLEGWLGRFGEAPEAYARTLRTAAAAIKRVDPAATVLFGSLAFDFFDDPLDAELVPLERGGAGIFRRDFLDRVLAAGAGPDFDGLGFHYFTDYEARWRAKQPALGGLAAKAAVLRATLRRHGLEKPLYLTEVGFPSAAQPGASAVLPGRSGTEEDQARFVVYLAAQALGAGVKAVVWYKLIDDPWDTPTNGFGTHGLIGRQGERKPAYTAYRVAAQTLGSATLVRPA